MKPMRRSQGFTLLEFLIGMTLLGFILTLLFAGLSLGMRSWDAGEQHMVSSSRQAVIVDFIRRTLEQTYPMHWRVDNEDQLAFMGESDSLRLVAPVPIHEGLASNFLVALDQVEGDGGHDLVMRWKMPDPGAPGFGSLDGVKPKTLVKGIKGMTFSYFGSESETDQPAWHDQWLHQKAPPDMIRLQFIMESGEAWPDIVAATPIRTVE
jgi:general secretion pathway protein J